MPRSVPGYTGRVSYTPPRGWIESISAPGGGSGERFHLDPACQRIKNPAAIRRVRRPGSASRCGLCGAGSRGPGFATSEVIPTVVSHGQVAGREVQDPQDLAGDPGEDERDAQMPSRHGGLLEHAQRHDVEERDLREVDHDLLRALLKDL